MRRVRTATDPDSLAERAAADADPDPAMAVRNREKSPVGVQFHPGSVPTDAGHQVVANPVERPSVLR